MKIKQIYPMYGKFFLLISIFFSILGTKSTAHAERIRVAGSSTVFPFVAVASEEFSRATRYKPPVIESTGTGGGFNLFCGKAGDNRPVINNASREIKASEAAKCKENGITDIVEFSIGYDGLAVANNADGPVFHLTTEQLRRALAYYVVIDGALRTNPYKTWDEISPELPGVSISAYGPPTTSGTRDAFNELVMIPECEKIPEMLVAYPQKKERRGQCTLMREDGRFIDSTENDNLIIQKLRANPAALGIFGYSFLEQNSTAIRGATINGVIPQYQNIASGSYPLIRPLYVYVNGHRVKALTGMKAFLTELLGENAVGPDGYLTYKGLIPASAEHRKNNLKKLSRM